MNIINTLFDILTGTNKEDVYLEKFKQGETISFVTKYSCFIKNKPIYDRQVIFENKIIGYQYKKEVEELIFDNEVTVITKYKLIVKGEK